MIDIMVSDLCWILLVFFGGLLIVKLLEYYFGGKK